MPRDALNKLARVLGLLGSDQPGERASAALAAHKMVEAMDTSWRQLLRDPGEQPVKVVVKRVRDYDLDQAAAAEARMRQLKAANDRLEKENRALRRRLTTIADQQRRRRLAAELEEEDRGA
ncbi:MAG: hypothetical protein ACTHOR_06475 [Devosia sp.]